MDPNPWNVSPGEHPPPREGSWSPPPAWPGDDPTISQGPLPSDPKGAEDSGGQDPGADPADSEPPPAEGYAFPPPPPPIPPIDEGTGGNGEGGGASGGTPDGDANDALPPLSPPSMGASAGRRALVIGVVVALLAAAGGFAAGRITHTSSPSAVLSQQAQSQVPNPVGTTGTTAPPPLSGTEAEPAEAVAKVLRPAVVQLQTSDGLGSGVLYDKSGLIMTAAHVVGTNSAVTVLLGDGTQTQGKVLGTNTATDIAVLKIDPTPDLQVAQLGINVDMQVGQMAVAIGSPYGLDETVTAGIISATDRSVPTTGNHEVPMLQTDAPINPGNSGGALADRLGRVIGINDAIYSGSGGSGLGGEAGNVGVGFAIPIALARAVADHIVAGQPFETGVLGVEVSQATGKRVGALIASVSGGTPADKAGLRKGDVVIAVNGSPVESNDDLVAAVQIHQAGERITITYLRNGAQHSTVVTLGRG